MLRRVCCRSMGYFTKTSNAGTAVGQGVDSVEGNGNLYKTKNLYQLFLFLFSNNVDLKKN